MSEVKLVQLLLNPVNLLGLFLQLLLQVADDEDMIWSLQEMIWILLLLRHGANARLNGAAISMTYNQGRSTPHPDASQV